MTQKVHSTLRNFISSNNAFCDALRQDQICLDNNVLIELIIYYLTLNRKYINMLSTENKTIIQDLINTQNFYIEEEKIIIYDTVISLEYLKQIVLELEEKIKPLHKGKILYFQELPTKSLKVREHTNIPNTKLKVIPLDNSKKSIYYTIVEREVEYERTTNLNAKTRPYINESKENYLALVDDVVHKAITNNLDNYSIKYLKVIASYLQLYPFTTYLHGKKTIPYEVLSIDHSKIGIRKTTHTESEINRLKRELIELVRTQQQLEYKQEQEVHNERIKSNQLTITEQALLNIDKAKLQTMLEIYELEHSPKIYNKNLIEHIALALEDGTLSINRFFANPLLRIYLVDEEHTYFHCSIHLDTLFNLINSNQLLAELETPKKLRLLV